MSAFYSPGDMVACADAFGAACGHGALAAALGVPVCIVMAELFPDSGGWLNVPMMNAAAHKAEREVKRLDSIPSNGDGVALIQWLGRWMEPGVPPQARCAHRHWIAFRGGLVWDANRTEWITFESWNEWVPTLYGAKTAGHEVAAAYLLLTKEKPKTKETHATD